MFGFGKKKTQADAVIEIMDEVIDFAADRWLYFTRTLAFKDDVDLGQRIYLFSTPFAEGAKLRFPVLKKSPDSIFLVFAAKGVERSRTHTRSQIEQALGLHLPD